MSLTWLLQSNRLGEAGVDAIAACIDPERIELVEAAFDVIEPEPDPGGRYVVYGSTSLVRYAAERGLGPGLWPNTDHDHKDWVFHWGERMLNYQASYGPLHNVPKLGSTPFFIRPSDDLKAFPGQIVAPERASAWVEYVESYYRADPGHEVIVAPVVPIEEEARLFVVAGQIVSASVYRRDNELVQAEEPLAADLLRFAVQAIKDWQPADAFVLDVCRSEGELRIIEVNSINCSGLYGCHAQWIVHAIEELLTNAS